MKKNVLYVLAGLVNCMVVSPILSQQKPHYTQYILNQYIINPALTGIENYVDLKLSHRHQWVGLRDAPVTTYLSVHGPIGKTDYRTTATSFELKGENPRGKRYWEEYTAPAPHHGIGVQVINDVTGPLRNFSAYGTYAYHLAISPRTSLAGGFGVGFNRISLDADKLSFGDVMVDPVVYSQGILNKTRLDLMVGLYLYSGSFFAGVSAQQIVPQKIDFSNGYIRPEQGRTVPHLFGTAGFRVLLSETVNLIPSVMVKYVDPLPIQVEGNLKLQYLDRIWIGGSYRYKDGYAGMAGINVSNIFHIGYAYDYTTSRLNNFSKGTHEILVGFVIGGYPDNCPTNIW